MRKLLALFVALAPMAFLLGDDADGKTLNQISAGPGFGFAINREPILNFDVTGSTLLGPLHYRATVYSDGLVTGSDCGGFGGGNSGGTAAASTTSVKKLQEALIAAGGLTLGDQQLTVADVPLTTVTVFGPSRKDGTTKANTFSYWLATGAYSQIGALINEFLTENPTACFSITPIE